MDEASGVDTEQEEEATPDFGKLDRALSFANLASDLKKKDPDKLGEIGRLVVDGYENDDTSRQGWLERNRDYMKLATQVMERKSFPWEGAANVKYPLLTTASLQFASRAYSSLVPSLDVVKAKVIGDDKDGQMTALANKLSTHLSYLVTQEIEDWEEDMDKLCFILPIVGTMFKKVYYSEGKKKICSELLSPKNVVINYYVKKLQNASRITEVQWWTPNEIKEKQLKSEWLEYDEQPFGPGSILQDDASLTDSATTGMSPPSPDEETPRKVLVQCCRLDLDGDDYKEPYIVTVDYETQKVLSIKANFYAENVEWRDAAKKEVACITPAQWFVKFDFLPNPDGGFYGIGFGILLGGLNDMVNTLTNQILDAGTISNLQAGFIGRGLRDNKQKNMSFRPGEWKWVNNPGKDLKENIFPLPVREPSQTLFNLLGTLVQSGKETASVADIMTGKMPGQNTPASTTMATIEQGLKVFTSIYKRIFRAMGKEFQLIGELCKRYAPAEIVTVVGQINGEKHTYGVSRFDYEKAGDLLKIIPAADPNMVSETQKLLRIQGLYELVQFGTINAQEMTRQALLYQGQDNVEALMQVPPPPEPLEIQLKKMELQDAAQQRQLDAMKIQSENSKRQSEIMLNMAKAKQLGDEEGLMMLEAQLEQQKHQAEIQLKYMELMFKKQEHQMDMQFKHEEHEMDMQVKDSEARLNLALKQKMGEQDVEFNEQMNSKQLEMADSSHNQELQHGHTKHKQALKQGEEKHKVQLKQTKEKEKVKPSGNRKGSMG